MLEIYEKWPLQVRESLGLNLPKQGSGGYTKVLVAGVGGSGIVGDFLNRLSYQYHTRVPIITVKDMGIPMELVDETTLLIAVSYSGNTLEMLTTVKEAVEAGATIKGVTSGGKLKELLGDENIVKVPSGYPPRASFPYLFIPAIRILINEGVIGLEEDELNKLAFHMDYEKNRIISKASTLADLIIKGQGKTPVMVTCRKYYPVVLRGRQEFAENSKLVSIAEEVPDAGHNLLVGYSRSNPKWLIVGVFPQEELCDNIVESYLKVQGSVDFRIVLNGEGIMQKMMSGAWLFGFTSVFIARNKGLDPEDISQIKAYRKLLEETFTQ
ncbi:MAG: SIS domain-containing protein [Desulfurococcales archaeon]|nr:SIS domain-containing protein [Desulfurococcales archaeon]